MIGFFAGLEPNRLNAHVLRFTRGAAVSAFDENVMMKFPSSQNDVDLRRNGLWGLDKGKPLAGAHIFPYLLRNDATGESGIIISSSKIMDGVVCPNGFEVKRKQSFGLVLSAGGVIPAFHASNFPKPTITYTDFQDPVLPAAASGSGLLNLTRYVPDNARLVRLHCQVYAPSRAGSAYIRSTETSEWQSVGSANPGLKADATFVARCSSTGMIPFRSDGGAVLKARVVDYSITEPMV